MCTTSWWGAATTSTPNVHTNTKFQSIRPSSTGPTKRRREGSHTSLRGRTRWSWISCTPWEVFYMKLLWNLESFTERSEAGNTNFSWDTYAFFSEALISTFGLSLVGAYTLHRFYKKEVNIRNLVCMFLRGIYTWALLQNYCQHFSRLS